MIILFGPAGSGKSTQGQILAKKFGWQWLSVGQVIRNTGKFDEITQRGGLVDDNIVIELMKNEMEKAETEGMNAILDGYPRDVVQAEWMAENIAEKIEGAIMLDVPEEELLRRIEIRGRSDDIDAVVRTRFKIFWDNIEIILPILEKAGIRCEKVDGVGEFDEVTERLVKKVEEWTGETMEAGEFADEVEKEHSYGE